MSNLFMSRLISISFRVPFMDLPYPSWTPTAGTAAQGVAAADPGPDYEKNRDIIAEIQRDWLLLRPGYFYGRVAILSFVPTKPGKYTLIGAYRSNHLTDNEVGPVSRLKYRVVTGTYSSAAVPIVITAVSSKGGH